ncbi:hypothetical protein ES703_92310 [subsurface metagenome]
MKKVLIVVLVVLVGCVAGLIITYQSLGTTQDQLQEMIATLQETTKSLEENTQELRDQKNQTEYYMQLYESNLKEQQDQEEELDTVAGELALSQQINLELQEIINEIQNKLDLYEDTLGTQVFSGAMPPYWSGNLDTITLINQSTAKNPTWQELQAFLREDKTDKNLYVLDIYVCGGFAQDLHNNAEARGIRAAFVVVHYQDETIDSHAINAFKTVDKGLVYIDCTGWEYPFDITNYDRSVEIAKDEPYVESLLFPEGWELTPGDDIIKSIEIYW